MPRRAWLAAVAVFALAAVGAALYTQHGWDMLPCPWCVLQRLVFVAIAAVALLGLLWPPAGAAGVLALGACGVAAALWQHFVAASSASCDQTMADRIVAATGLDGRFPEVFMAMTTCADGAVDLAGLPYELWSLAAFALCMLGAALALRARR
ncbi:MAG: disulfide bond formation protein B [Burkholderiales bacterium]|nr:disulfide bond formation protein B [Burkholderiales bacterium]